MRIVFFGLCLCLVAKTVHAGAWGREPGQIFLSFGANAWASDWDDNSDYYDTTLFGEYGLTDRVTIGFDYFTSDQDDAQTAMVFAQLPLGDVTGQSRYAVRLGFGLRDAPGEDPDYLMRGGVSWGRGLNQGWLAIDASATVAQSDHVYRPKADFTWGHNLTDDWATMLQLQTGEGTDGAPFARISPAIIYSVTETARVTLGLVQPLNGSGEASIRVGIWASY